MALKSIRELSVIQFKRAATIKARIEKLEDKLTALLGIPEAITVGGVIRRHRRMSAAARAKIAAAQKARWAKVRREKGK